MEKTTFLSVVSVFLLNYLMACLARTVTNLTTDQSALLAFKAHITVNPNYDLLAKNWSTTTSVCNWIGVSCGVNHQRVTTLNISNIGLMGTISPHLGNLSFLASLDISGNEFYGHIPGELAHMHRLKEVNLALNKLSGEIPSWFGIFLPKLQHLLLYSNNFTGTIPPSLCNISKLETLNIRYNFLSGSIPEGITNLSNLKLLWLGYNKLTGSGFHTFQYNIFNMSSLRSVDLSASSLTGSLPVDMCGHLSKLNELSLSHNFIHGQVPRSLFKCRELRFLSFYNNELTGSIPIGIGNLSMLEVLDVSANYLEGILPGEIGDLDLKILSVSYNSLTGPIPQKIFNMSTINVIDLNQNHFSGHLPSSMGHLLPNLEEFYLHQNQLSGAIPSSITNGSMLTILDISQNLFTGFIPNTLGNLRILEMLILFGNNFTGEWKFLSSLTNCRHLRRLSLSLNPLDGVLPISIGNLSSSLQDFLAQYCNIRSHIPEEIGNLSSIGTIALSGNELTGPIPTTLGRLQNMERLYFELNQLQGSIPKNLCHLGNLGMLDLSFNQLNGSIPPCLGKLSSLRYLRLDTNKLVSMIPLNLWNLKDLLYLDLSSNSLSGNLPLDIGNLKVVIEINLSRNLLSGDIPSTIGVSQSLVNLSLAHNKLQGSIPQSMGNLISLELLYLSNNSLSGLIPKSLETLKDLQILNLSFNKLYGEIPSGGHFTNFTSQSFMHNDALCGAPQLQVPPCKIETLQQSRSTIVMLLKYILPPIVSIVLVAALIIVFIRCRNHQMKVRNPVDSQILSWRRVSYHEILQATNTFNESNLLGMVSFGSVFKGTLSDGMSVAIKVFNLQLEGAFKSFDVECEIMRNIRHRNLVRIISSCTNMDFKALVLEYMPNGCLEKWLHAHDYCLDMLQRLNIMMDVALSLEYLHYDYTMPIVHCDLKPSNILLDEDMTAHVCDFGIAKLLGEGEFVTQTKTLATIGYMAPEYGTEGIISTRGDVYSYGIILMEAFTRKKPTDEMFHGEMSLKHWVSESLYGGSITEIVDTNLIWSEDANFFTKKQLVLSILHLAMDCSTNIPEQRINMRDVVARLQKIKINFLANNEKA